jgi:hypothetical protein
MRQTAVNLSDEDRAGLNALLVNGQLDAARSVERLIMDDETVLRVCITAGIVRIEIAPPRRESPLWEGCAVHRSDPRSVVFVCVRFGCQIRWALSRAEAELRRIADSFREPK